ncbi:MAG TPA: type II secretion system protein M [Gammaproteobacteria bacterium]|nr:type II secretion system protein M [Gammaproteobacteria bacterium]
MKSFSKKMKIWLVKGLAWYQTLFHQLLTQLKPYQKKISALWLPQQEKILLSARPRLAQLKTRWQTLDSREKNMLLGGAFITSFLLFYALIWSPFHSHLELLRQQIRAEKKTIAWMQVASKQLQALEGRQSMPSAKLLSERINLVQEDLRQTRLSKNITRLTQSSSDEIRCSFDRVDFDTLIKWLIPFSQQHDLTVKQASVRRLNTVGLVQAEFVFQVGH